MGLWTIVSRACLAVLFFYTGISAIADLPHAQRDYETVVGSLLSSYQTKTGGTFYLPASLLIPNAYLFVTLWSCAAVVASIVTLLKVKWGACVLISMLVIQSIPAWYDDSIQAFVTLLKNVSMIGGLVVMMDVIAQKQTAKARKQGKKK